MSDIVIGECTVVVDENWVEIKEAPGRGLPEIEGLALQATYSTTDGGFLRAAFVVLSDGTMVMKGMALLDGPSKYSRLVQAGRMEVVPFGEDSYSCRVRAMRFGATGRQNLAGVSWDELNGLIAGNAKSLLSTHGASEFGRAGEILNVTSGSVNQEAMLFPKDDPRALFAVWGMTRVIPVMKDFGRDGVGVLN